jgi:small subunit ribosomal protein S16
MVKIRLMRMGKRKQPYYRVVVADARSPRDGRFIENIGKYHPRAHPSVIDIDQDRALHWLRNGAQPSDPVRVLLEKTGIWGQYTGRGPTEAVAPPPDEQPAPPPEVEEPAPPAEEPAPEARAAEGAAPEGGAAEEGAEAERPEEDSGEAAPATREGGEETP